MRLPLASVALGKYFDVFHCLSTMKFKLCAPGGSLTRAVKSFACFESSLQSRKIAKVSSILPKGQPGPGRYHARFLPQFDFRGPSFCKSPVRKADDGILAFRLRVPSRCACRLFFRFPSKKGRDAIRSCAEIYRRRLHSFLRFGILCETPLERD